MTNFDLVCQCGIILATWSDGIDIVIKNELFLNHHDYEYRIIVRRNK